jgi:hypothetical protein
VGLTADSTVLMQVGPCDAEPKVEGPCEAAIQSWSFIKETGVCEEFTYGGCKGTENRFGSLAECEKTCVPVDCICTLVCPL